MLHTQLDTGFVTRLEFNEFKNMNELNFTKIDENFFKIDKKFDYLTETMINGFDRIYDRIDVKFWEVDKRFDKLERDMNLIKKHFGIKDATINA